MFYILIDKKTNRVVNISKKGFSSYSDNLQLAEVESLPDKYDYLTAENIREKTDTWEDVIEDYDGNGNIVAKTEERSRTYFTCDLVAKFRPQPTTEQLEALKEKRCDDLAKKYIRQLYDADKEFKILRKRDVEPEKFEKYYNDVEDCIARAKKEIYGK